LSDNIAPLDKYLQSVTRKTMIDIEDQIATAKFTLPLKLKHLLRANLTRSGSFEFSIAHPLAYGDI